MKRSALLSLTRRANKDIDDLINFVGRFPRGKPEDRRHDI